MNKLSFAKIDMKILIMLFNPEKIVWVRAFYYML